jgi:hypothetical protein
VRKGNVSITPVTLDCTAPSAGPALAGLFAGKVSGDKGVKR